MKKVIYGISVILTFFILTICSLSVPTTKTSSTADMRTFEVKLQQNNRIMDISEDKYTIADNKFELLIPNESKSAIHIFVYHSDEMFTKYTYPIKCENTVIFHPATVIIDNANENKEITLTINRETQYNIVTPEKRVDDTGISTIRIKDISDTDDKFAGTLYLTIFIDLNNNNVIENNEIKNLSVVINKAKNSILFKARIWISTIGGWLYDINYPVYGNDYFYVRISNAAEKARFFEIFGQHYGDYSYSPDNRIRDLDYSKNNMYIVFSPITTEIELYNNPYRFTGENRIIFGTRINRESTKGRYVFYREYRVEKSRDIYEIWIEVNGTIKRINELKLK